MTDTADPHEQTVVAVDPGLRPAAPPTDARARARPGPRLAAAVLAALAALAAVFVLLPRWVGQAGDEPRPLAVEIQQPAVPEPVSPALSPAELETLRAEAETLLAQLLPQQRRLGDQGASDWGGEEWLRYLDVARTADDAYLADDFRTAVTSYGDALAIGEALAQRSRVLVTEALETGQRALTMGDPALAIEQFDRVLRIEPNNAAAQAGRARGERLPDVLAAMADADAHRDAGALEEAAAGYRRALGVDSQWEPARAALANVSQAIENARFESLVSSGYAALDVENYRDAAEHFRAALAMRPSAAAARDGLLQAEQGAELDRIALAEARALAFERRELWDQAIAQYRAALAADPTLAFARTGLERASVRADLDAKLAHLIGNPSLLFDDAVLADAEALLEQADAHAEPGPRLTEQMAELDRLVTLATTPLRVQLRSDELTEVTLYRVGRLGAFAAKEVELRPGTYTAVGSRNGYRDVRTTFTVLPGREPPPVAVVCSERI